MGRYRRLSSLVVLGIFAGACDSTAPPPPLDGRIDGTVHAEGEPLSGVLLRVEAADGAASRSAVSGVGGAFSFEGLEEGDYTVQAAGLPDRVRPEALEARASLSRQQPTRRVELAARLRRDASIVVEVVADGVGLPGLEVLLTGPETVTGTTDASGRAEFSGLVRGRFDVEVRGFDPVRWAFQATHSVVEAGGGAPVRASFAAVEIPRTPAGPTDFAAEPSSATVIHLVWSDAADNEDGFEIERRVGEGDWSQLAIPGADETAASDATVQPATTYAYRLRACNEHGCSDPWAEVEATTPDVPPATPTDLTAVAAGADAVALTWTDAAHNEDGIELERRVGAGGAWSALVQLDADAVAHRDEGLAEGTRYGYRVRACNEAGCSEWSGTVEASTSVLPPAAPTGISADAPSHDRVRVRWTPASGAEVSHFVLERRIASAPWSERTSPVGGSVAFEDTQVSASTSYGFRIRACNDAGCSGPSAIATVRTPVAPANLSIAAAYVVQRVQRTAGDVPLVAGVDGLLRVFPVADRGGLPSTPVRVEFLRSGAVVQTATIPAPGATMPTAVDESALSASWNLPVPASLLQPGLALRVTVDPDAQVAEGDEGDNLWPAGGPLSLDVRTTPDFAVTFVPVRQNATGTVGDVGPHNADSYLDMSRRTLPFAGDDVQFHAEFVTDQPALASDGSNWSAVLSEVAALRAAEGSARAYYGVVSPGYGGGVAGIGYIGWEIALGWDRASSRGSIAAHEWGHNFGRRHSPGCGAGNPDTSYPHAAGRIGAWGYDAATASLKSPGTHYDFMTYCGPEWISDYVFEQILQFRGPAPSPSGAPAGTASTGAAGATAGGGYAGASAGGGSTAASPGGGVSSAAPVDGLLVWGRVVDGELVLEPAFEVRAPARLPSRPGRLRLEGRTDTGVAFSLSFDPVPVADGGVEEGHFAFVIPLDRSRGALRSLHLSDGARRADRIRPPQQAPGIDPGTDLRIAAIDGTRAEVRWDRTRHPMALVRDADTGQVLAFARSGRVAVMPGGARLEVTLSDGLGSSDTRTARWR